MAVLNWTDGNAPYGRVFDANGLEWPECAEVDTETGRVDYFVKHPGGGIVIENGEPKREVAMTAAPLVFIPDAVQ